MWSITNNIHSLRIPDYSSISFFFTDWNKHENVYRGNHFINIWNQHYFRSKFHYTIFITDTTEDFRYDIPWVLIALYAIISLFIMSGNSLVIVAVARFQFLQTPTNLFVVGLACFDFALGFYGSIVAVHLIRPTLLHGYYACVVTTVFGVVNGLSSSMMLAG